MPALLEFLVGRFDCPFRALTGVSCAGCGSTRAVLALLTGHPLQALAFNPGLILGCAFFAAYLAWGFAYQSRHHAWPKGPAIPAGRWLALGALLSNWAYVIVFVP